MRHLAPVSWINSIYLMLMHSKPSAVNYRYCTYISSKHSPHGSIGRVIHDHFSVFSQHIETGTKWPPFWRLHFLIYLFFNGKCFYFDSNSTEICIIPGDPIDNESVLVCVTVGAEQSKNRYSKQRGPCKSTLICITKPCWVKVFSPSYHAVWNTASYLTSP